MILINDPVIEIVAGNINDSMTQEIYRNLQVLYNTMVGEQALDREFGIDGNCIDYPMEYAQAMLTAEYVRKTEKYEPRARVSRVDWENKKSTDGNTTPKVVVQLV